MYLNGPNESFSSMLVLITLTVMASLTLCCYHHIFSFSLSPVTDEKKRSEGVEVQNTDILKSSTCGYLVLDLVGEGCFGKALGLIGL